MIALTKESMQKRCLLEFGPTSLRGTVCNGLLRIAKINPGEVVLDPFCGGSSVGIEAVSCNNWSENYILNSDYHPAAISRSVTNLTNPSSSHSRKRFDLFQCSATCLPFRNGSIDVIVSDMVINFYLRFFDALSSSHYFWGIYLITHCFVNNYTYIHIYSFPFSLLESEVGRNSPIGIFIEMY